MRKHNPNATQPELPKSILGRILLGAICLPLLVLSAMFSYAYLCGVLSGRNAANTLEGHIFHHLGGMIFDALFLFSLLGLIWAAAAPTWIDQLFRRAAQKLTLLLALLCLLGLPFALWALFKV